MRVAFLLSILASPLAAAEPWGPWCDETGWDRITIAEHALFPDVQTVCPLATPFPEDGVFAGELQCVTTLIHGATAGDMVHIDVLIRIELRLLGEGVMQMRLDDGPPFELMHCHAVWPL